MYSAGSRLYPRSIPIRSGGIRCLTGFDRSKDRRKISLRTRSRLRLLAETVNTVRTSRRPSSLTDVFSLDVYRRRESGRVLFHFRRSTPKLPIDDDDDDDDYRKRVRTSVQAAGNAGHARSPCHDRRTGTVLDVNWKTNRKLTRTRQRISPVGGRYSRFIVTRSSPVGDRFMLEIGRRCVRAR